MERNKRCLALQVAMAVVFSSLRLLATSPQAAVTDDHTIISGIEEKLFQDSSLKQRDIHVNCKGGVVTLSGTVNTRLEKSAAERIASQEPGVQHVISQLKIAGAAPAPPPPPNKPVVHHVTIPAGTVVTVRMIDAIDAKTNQPGQEFAATLDSPMVHGDRVMIPKGAEARVRLVNAKQSGSMSGSSQLEVQLIALTSNGTTYQVSTGSAVQTGSSRGKSTGKRVGFGALAGGLIGGIAGGGKGMAIGAGAGAATGGIVQAVTKGPQVKIPPETKLDFTLKTPLTVKVPAPAKAQ
jgi:hypothetical protein